MDWDRRSEQERNFFQGPSPGFRPGATEAEYGGAATSWVYARRGRRRVGVRCHLVSVVSWSFERQRSGRVLEAERRGAEGSDEFDRGERELVLGRGWPKNRV